MNCPRTSVVMLALFHLVILAGCATSTASPPQTETVTIHVSGMA